MKPNPSLVALALLLLLLGAPGGPASAAGATDDPAAAALLERARLWFARDRPDLAREALQRLERVVPDHPQALSLHAELDIRQGRLAEAEALIARLRKLDARHPDIDRLQALVRLEGADKARLREARLLAKAGRTDAAIEAWRVLFPAGPPSAELAFEYWQLVAASPNSWAAVHEGLVRLAQQQPENLRFRFALAEHELSRSPLNAAALRRVIEMGKLPEFARQAQSAWRRAVLRQDASPQSVALLREYLAGDDADVAVRERLNEVLVTLDTAQKRVAADAARATRPTNPDGLQGLAALEQGDLQAAETLLERSLSQRGDDADVVGALGTVRLRQGRHAQAQTQFDRAAQLDPDRADKWRGLSRTAQLWGGLRASDEALDRGDAATAERLAAVALRLDPREPEALVAMARAQARQGQTAPAEANLRSALRIDPVHRGAFRALVSVLNERGDRAGLGRLIGGLSTSQQAALAPQIAAVRRDRLRDEGDRLAAAGRTDEAIALLQQAIELDPADIWVRYSLARLHAGRAEAELGRALLTERMQSNEPDTEALHALALYEAHLGNELQALQVLERAPLAERGGGLARTQRRLWFRVQVQRAEAALRAGERRRAAAVLREAEAAAAGDTDATLDVAEVWLATDEPERARQLADALPWAAASPPGARLRHARLLQRAGALEALPPVLQAVAAANGLTDAQQRELRDLRDALALHRAKRLRELDSLQAAVATLRERLRESPASVELLLAQAEQLRAAGRAAESIEHLQRAIVLEPANDDAYRAMVTTLMGSGERVEAKRMIDARLRQGSTRAGDVDTQVAMAGALVELGQFAAARQALDAVVAAAPGHALAWRQLAQLDLREGRASLAIERLQRAAELDTRARSASGTQRPLSRLSLAAPPSNGSAPVLQVTRADGAAVRAESSAWWAHRPLAAWLEQQSRWAAGAVDWRWRSGSDGRSRLDMQELPIELARPHAADARWVLRADVVNIDAGSLSLADVDAASVFGSVLLCQPTCTSGTSTQRDTGLALNAAYLRDELQFDVGVTPLGFAVQRPVGGLRLKGNLGRGGYSIDVSSRPVTSSLLAYAGTRDPRTGSTWGGVQATGVRLGLNRDEGGTFGAWSSFGLHQLHGKNVQGNLRRRAMGGVYWRAINEEQRVVSVGVQAMLQGFARNAGEFTFGHGGYYSPQSYRSISLPVSWAQRSGRWSFSARASLSRSVSRTDSAPFYPTDATMQAAAQALAAGNGVDPHYRGGRSSGNGHSLAVGFEGQLRPQWFFGGRFEIERSEDYAPNRAIVYLRFSLDAKALRAIKLQPDPVLPTSEY